VSVVPVSCTRALSLKFLSTAYDDERRAGRQEGATRRVSASWAAGCDLAKRT